MDYSGCRLDQLSAEELDQYQRDQEEAFRRKVATAWWNLQGLGIDMAVFAALVAEVSPKTTDESPFGCLT